MKTLIIIIIIITYSSVEANPDRSSWLVPPNATYRNEYSDCTRCATCNNCSFLLSRSSWMITPSGWNETVTVLTRPPFNLPSVHFYPYLCILLSTSCPWQYLYHHPLTQKITWTSTNEFMNATLTGDFYVTSINPDYLSQIEGKICLLCTCISHFKKDLELFCQQTKISCSNFPKMAETSFPKQYITVFSITIWLSDNSLPRKRFVLVNSKKETSPF